MINYVSSTTQILSCHDVKVSSTRPPVHDFFFFLCFLPHTTLHALQSVPRLYTGNGQVKTTDYLLHLSGPLRHHFAPFLPFIHLPSLFTLTGVSMHDTFAFGFLWLKTGCWKRTCLKHSIKETCSIVSRWV